MVRFKDKVVIITGGGGVLGGSIAKGFINEGAKVVLLGRTKKHLQIKLINLKMLNTEYFV